MSEPSEPSDTGDPNPFDIDIKLPDNDLREFGPLCRSQEAMEVDVDVAENVEINTENVEIVSENVENVVNVDDVTKIGKSVTPHVVGGSYPNVEASNYPYDAGRRPDAALIVDKEVEDNKGVASNDASDIVVVNKRDAEKERRIERASTRSTTSRLVHRGQSRDQVRSTQRKKGDWKARHLKRACPRVNQLTKNVERISTKVIPGPRN
jgi:hypothetical protein